MELDRCTDTPDREIIHGNVSLDTRFISLPLFCVSFGFLFMLYGCCHHTHTQQRTVIHEVVPIQLFASPPACTRLSKITLPRAESSHLRQDVTLIHLSR